MNITFNKESFEALDFETKCAIIQDLLPNDYFEGQMDIDFYYVEPKNINVLPLKTNNQELREDQELEALIKRLSIKLFENKTTINIDDDLLHDN